MVDPTLKYNNYSKLFPSIRSPLSRYSAKHGRLETLLRSAGGGALQGPRCERQRQKTNNKRVQDSHRKTTTILQREIHVLGMDSIVRHTGNSPGSLPADVLSQRRRGRVSLLKGGHCDGEVILLQRARRSREKSRHIVTVGKNHEKAAKCDTAAERHTTVILYCFAVLPEN